MSIIEQQISDRAQAMFTDMKFGIMPASRPTAIAWFNQALKWARRNDNPCLAYQIENYLAEMEKIPAEETFDCPDFLAA